MRVMLIWWQMPLPPWVERPTIAIDLSQDSLADIAEAINDRAAVLVSNVSASVVSTTEDGVTTYRLKIENTTGYTDDDNVLQTLGLLKGDQSDVATCLRPSSTHLIKTDAPGALRGRKILVKDIAMILH